MNVSVTSVSKKATKLNDSPAAVTVITGDEILRLGITTVPGALRLVPGLDVARVDASQWAISSRGFNRDFSNKLLVLVDGRSIYTPAFGGVNWRSHDLLLEDLDRIEVIRGPGATLWGANAVNGVINIISKSSKDTQGLLASTALGTEEQPLASIRYGGEINPTLHYRTYLRYFDREGFSNISGMDSGDDWESIRGGFRTDWQASVQDLVTVQGDYFHVGSGNTLRAPTFTPPYITDEAIDNTNRGGNLVARWTRTISENSHLSLQGYFDTTHSELANVSESRRTGDLQLEHRFPIGTRNDIVWGVGYRYTTDHFDNSEIIRWNTADDELHLFNTFIQDEITLAPDRLYLTLGSKFEHNDYTGWELQPGARLLWKPAEKHSVWASASHAVSTPGRFYRDGEASISIFQPPGGPLVRTAVFGNDGVEAESLDAFEIGYRMEVTPELSFDLATFYNKYDDVVGIVPRAPGMESSPVPHLLVPFDFENNVSGETYGAELSVQWMPTDYWKIIANYSFIHMQMSDPALAQASPQQQAGLRSYLTLPKNFELNGALYFVDRISPSQLNGTAVDIPAYLRADLGIVWHATPSLEIGLWGHNLLDGNHPEFTSQTSNQISEVPRSIMGKLTWRF